jgi:hypothetical protein
MEIYGKGDSYIKFFPNKGTMKGCRFVTIAVINRKIRLVEAEHHHCNRVIRSVQAIIIMNKKEKEKTPKLVVLVVFTFVLHINQIQERIHGISTGPENTGQRQHSSRALRSCTP